MTHRLLLQNTLTISSLLVAGLIGKGYCVGEPADLGSAVPIKKRYTSADAVETGAPHLELNERMERKRSAESQASEDLEESSGIKRRKLRNPSGYWKQQIPTLQQDIKRVYDEKGASVIAPVVIETLAERGIHKPEGASDTAYMAKVQRILWEIREESGDQKLGVWQSLMPGLKDACIDIMRQRAPSAPQLSTTAIIRMLEEKGFCMPEGASNTAFKRKVLRTVKTLFEKRGLEDPYRIYSPNLKAAVKRVYDEQGALIQAPRVIQMLAEMGIEKPQDVPDSAYMAKIQRTLWKIRKESGDQKTRIVWESIMPGLKDACTDIIRQRDPSAPQLSTTAIIRMLEEKGFSMPEGVTNRAIIQKIRKTVLKIREDM